MSHSCGNSLQYWKQMYINLMIFNGLFKRIIFEVSILLQKRVLQLQVKIYYIWENDLQFQL